MSDRDDSAFDRWLLRLTMIGGIAVLGFTSFLIYRIAMVAYRTEQAVQAISADMKQVTGTAATVSRKVDDLIAKVDKLEMKMKEKYREQKEEVRYVKQRTKEEIEEILESDDVKAYLKEKGQSLWSRVRDKLKDNDAQPETPPSQEPKAPAAEPIETPQATTP